jgi:phosphoglycerol transferase MdoB-like AlkP superfamily enzyme
MRGKTGVHSLIFLLFMGVFSEILSRQSTLSPLRCHLRMEAPLLFCLYWAFCFALRPGKLSPWIAALPFVVSYAASDIFFLAYGDVLRAVDLQNLPELIQVLPWIRKIGFLLAVGLPPALLVIFADYRRYWRPLLVTALSLLGCATVKYFPQTVIAGMNLAHLEIAVYSDAQSVNDNGRLTMVAYFEASRRLAFRQTELYRKRTEYDQQLRAKANFLSANGNRHNVFLVVLESFLDPTLFQNVSFSKDPRHPDFTQLVGDQQSFSISPVFGGGTAQAEFEALCGVPALGELSEIEFDNFTGHAAGCMPGILHQAGYQTYVSNIFEPDYFNSTKAYTGAGFDHLYYPIEYSRDRQSYLTIKNASEDETYLFDGDLFDQNINFVRHTLQQNPGQPIFNYVLTMYGHEPHDIDTRRRPLVLSMKAPHGDQQLLRAANQYWYRTQAIASYIRRLIALDPNSIIIMVSDHVPPLNEGMNSYRDFHYLDNSDEGMHLNRIIVVENGKVVKHQTIHHYQIPEVIYNYLTGEKYCQQGRCDLSEDQREDQYHLLISRAVAPM